MITSIHFQNFKALRDATLPLGPFTIIVGPNGSGKSTAMEAFDFVSERQRYHFKDVLSSERLDDSNASVSVHLTMRRPSKFWLTR